YQILDPARDVAVLDASGNTVETLTNVSRVELGSTWAPTQLKQGAGGNFRVFRRSFLELDLRVGLGLRQTIASGLKVYQDLPNGTGKLVAVEDSNLFGLETTFVALGRVSSFISLSSELDALIPVTADTDSVFTWRNQLTLRLVSF